MLFGTLCGHVSGPSYQTAVFDTPRARVSADWGKERADLAWKQNLLGQRYRETRSSLCGGGGVAPACRRDLQHGFTIRLLLCDCILLLYAALFSTLGAAKGEPLVCRASVKGIEATLSSTCDMSRLIS